MPHKFGRRPRPRRPLGKADTGARAEPAARLNRPVPLRAPTGWEGRRPRRPQQYRAHGTVPLPQGTKGGTASSRSARIGGYGGPCPSRGSPNRRHPSPFDRSGGTVSSRSARKGRPRAPLRNLQLHPMAGCPCELRQVGEGPRPRRRQEHWAHGTVPLPQGPTRRTATSRSARMRP
jgi:hypothetical protein